MTANAWAALFSGGTFLTAILASVLALLQLLQYTEARLEDSRPFVTVDFYFRETLVCIAAQNVGKSPAMNVKITFDPPLKSTTVQIGEQIRASLSKPIPMMAPNRKLAWLLDSSTVAFSQPEIVPHSYKVKVTYSGPLRFHRNLFGKSKTRTQHYEDPEQVLVLHQYLGALIQELTN